MTFNGKLWDSFQIFDLVKTRMAWWTRSKWKDETSSVMDIFRTPQQTTLSKKPLKKKITVEWKAPNHGQLKFNIDGAAKGNPGEFGIGGVLRDSHGRVFMTFSKATGVGDASRAELLAIKEALFIYVASNRVDSHQLVLKSDSVNVIKWVKCPEIVPWRHRKHILHIIKLTDPVWGGFLCFDWTSIVLVFWVVFATDYLHPF
ncbi:Uncharacterized protein TCM_034977 [Theobroma cacao]|uniref:RNase H type-1 domain-containing protein n=1 Tax=Theobroma cacao TaxID=3641 RepID=A0A061FHB9_THECC|nr:Uncharacterized protein TCM_034977 [Theobroma cacao]